MWREEILGLKWEHIDWDNYRAFLPLTKNHRLRWVPLSVMALKQLNDVPCFTDLIFRVNNIAFRIAWNRLRKRANLNGVTFHDLRHIEISRVFERGMRVPEVMSVSGH